MSAQVIAVIVAISSAFSTGLVTFAYKVFEDVINQRLQQWGLIKEDKRKMAEDIIALCAEGQESEYKNLPEDERKIYRILNNLESMESEILEYFVNYYNLWITTCTVVESSIESKDLTTELLRETDTARKKLVKAVGKWKNS